MIQTYQPLTARTIHQSPYWHRLSPEHREAVEIVSLVLPFRTNAYVCRELIDWSNIPDDPMFQLTFPQQGMLQADDYQRLLKLKRAGAAQDQIRQEVQRIRQAMNPHPAGQMTDNVPTLNDEPIPGIQHKYRETVLYFPSRGQTCHAYCTYCFRWAQFVGETDWKFSSANVYQLVAYLKTKPDVTDVLITGGDPLVMRTDALAEIINALLVPELNHIRSIRLGTKSLAWNPTRFTEDDDSEDLLRLFERAANNGRHLAVMAHFSHPVELQPKPCREAIKRILATGAQIRMQAPLVRHVNNNADAWKTMWEQGVNMGMIPYYMFVERNTGPQNYFDVPLITGWNIYREAIKQVSGLARTVRGPSMSAHPGKVMIVGVQTVFGQPVMVLKYLQHRDPAMVGIPFFAQVDPHATWFDQLKSLDETSEPFFHYAKSHEEERS